VSITKVVGFFTKNPTQKSAKVVAFLLGLHFSVFSTILYGFYKNQLNTCTI
jgi:hypothetical protein